jgi:hypothetical protein
MGGIFCCQFFVVNGIDIHQWNFGPFRNLKFLIDNPSKKMCFLHLFCNKCIIMSSFKEKTTTIWKSKKFYRWALYYFLIFLLFANVLWIINMKYLWLLKKCKLYILSTLILLNLFHFTIGSKLTLTQNELWVPKCSFSNFEFFLPIFRIAKRCHQDLTWNLLYIIFFGERWFTFKCVFTFTSH